MDIIIDAIVRLLSRAGCWRTLLCLSLGTVLGMVVHAHISADPLRWIVAGAIVFVSVLYGLKWEGYRTDID